MKKFGRLLGLSAGLVVACAFATGARGAELAPESPPADLVLRDATIATLVPNQPVAQALAIRDDKIQALGSNDGMQRYIGPHTKVLDLHGAFVTPGFFDSHGHVFQTGLSLLRLNVGKPKTWRGIVAMVKQAVAQAKPGQWIVGSGWQPSKWTRVPEPNVDGLPLPASLDAVSPNNPVMLITAARHGVYANAAALEAAGITDETSNPPGGTIVRGPHGHAVGMLRDTAAAPVHAAYKEYLQRLPASVRAARREREFKLWEHNEVSKGITFFVDMGEDFKTADWMQQQAAKGMPLRLQVNIAGVPVAALDEHLASHRTIGYAHDHFNVRGVGEILSDGALGTRSAWMLKPYADDPDNTGKNVTPMAKIAQIAKIAARDHFQLAVHAIGDRANREVLNLYQRIFNADPAAHALRWRIEHAQLLNPADIPRFAKLGVIASMQSIQACSDTPMVVPRIGEKRARQGAYAWRKLEQTGAMIVEGTDTPVEDTNPIPNFFCAVTREYQPGEFFFPEETLTRMQELRDNTWNAAYAVFQEHQLGSLAPGKLADIDVFSGNLLTEPAYDILRTRVLYTIVGGKIVYQRPGAEKWRKGQLFKAMPEYDHVE
jgi:predicted amidohydrolase YtcJ